MTYFVQFAPRQEGKTYSVMTEIHDLIIKGERPWIMVVFPTMNYVHWWGRMWLARFPSIPLPNYTSVQSMDRVRGRRLRHVFVEDIDGVVDGIYDEKLDHLRVALESGGTITFTCSPLPEQVWRTRPDDWTEEAAELRRAELERQRKHATDQYILAYMQAYIERTRNE